MDGSTTGQISEEVLEEERRGGRTRREIEVEEVGIRGTGIRRTGIRGTETSCWKILKSESFDVCASLYSMTPST